MTQPDETQEPAPEAADTQPDQELADAQPVETQGTPTEPEPDAAGDKVVGLQGTAVNRPGGLWLAKVDPEGELVQEDGLLVRERETTAL